MLLLLLAVAAIAGAGGDVDRGDEDDDVAADDRPAAAPTTTLPGFGEGTKRVGDEVAPGLYVATEVDACHWERRRGVGGGSGEIVASDDTSGQAIVEIVATDVAFDSAGCGRWVVLAAVPRAADSFGEGDYAVNAHIRPGRYRSGGGSRCSWQRSTNFRGEGDGIIAEATVVGTTVVDIAPTDVAFSSSGCGGWRRLP